MEFSSRSEQTAVSGGSGVSVFLSPKILLEDKGVTVALFVLKVLNELYLKPLKDYF